MKTSPLVTWLFLALLLVTLAACGKGALGTPTSNPNLVYTQIWETVVVGQTQTQAALPPTQAATSTPEITSTPRNTNTPLVSSTPAAGTVSVTPAVKNTTNPSTGGACDNATFVADVTYPDNSEVPAGQPIIKTWRIKNLGPCTWNQDYTLVYAWGGDGTNWSKNSASHFVKLIPPGDMIDLSMELDVPSEPGTYTGVFRTMNDNDYFFGPTLTIVIKVK
jgi:predicted small lipoprotein YifL